MKKPERLTRSKKKINNVIMRPIGRTKLQLILMTSVCKQQKLKMNQNFNYTFMNYKIVIYIVSKIRKSFVRNFKTPSRQRLTNTQNKTKRYNARQFTINM